MIGKENKSLYEGMIICKNGRPLMSEDLIEDENGKVFVVEICQTKNSEIVVVLHAKNKDVFFLNDSLAINYYNLGRVYQNIQKPRWLRKISDGIYYRSQWGGFPEFVVRVDGKEIELKKINGIWSFDKTAGLSIWVGCRNPNNGHEECFFKRGC